MGHFIFPRLTDEKQFEHLVADCYKASYPSAQVDEYGRRGQKQYGIDITVQIGPQLWCIQCKNSETISVSEIEKILINCTYYGINPFSKFVIATAASNNTEIIDYLVQARRTRRFPFEVEFLPWEKICDSIESHPQIAQKYYASIRPADTFKNNFLEIIKRYEIGSFLNIDPMTEGLDSNIPSAIDSCAIELQTLLILFFNKNKTKSKSVQ